MIIENKLRAGKFLREFFGGNFGGFLAKGRAMEQEKVGKYATKICDSAEIGRLPETTGDCQRQGLDMPQERNSVFCDPSRAGSLQTRLFGRTTDNASSYALLDTTSEKQLAEYIYGTGANHLMSQGATLAYCRAHFTKLIRKRGLQAVAYAIGVVISSGETNAKGRIVEISKAHALQALQGIKDSENAK